MAENKTETTNIGTLYICGTPIGNLEDITLRALKTLKEVDLIAAEDTRQTIKLLNHFDIKTPLTSYHEHNKGTKGIKIIEMLKNGKNIALVSDAGMPGISDPGEDLIKLCYENSIPFTIVPGPTAVITGLVISGISSRSYCFEGFLPSGKKQRKEILNRLKNEQRTAVLYEAPHHLIQTLKELYDNIGDRYVAVIRELTKKHETVNSGNLKNIICFFEENIPKGEFVIVIEGVSKEIADNEKKENFLSMSIEEHMEIYLKKGVDNKTAMKQVAKDRGVGKRDIYAVLNKN